MARSRRLTLFKAFFAAVSLLSAGAVQAQLNLTGLLRSVTGAVAPEQKPQVQQGLTTTMGVRGIDDVQTTPVSSVSTDIKQLDNWVATPEAAQAFAGSRGLVARSVTLGSQPVPQPMVQPMVQPVAPSGAEVAKP